MAFLDIEDMEGKGSAVVFPDIFEKANNFLVENRSVFVQASVNFRNDEFSLIIEDIADASDIDKQDQLSIDISREKDKSRLMEIKKAIIQNPGNIKLTIIYGDLGAKKSIERFVRVSPEFITTVKKYIYNE